ncbi:hypothetical protein [Bifidobacterium scaligerum]|uniref:Uncharacterized protein n=1 Tax=Bifidobacterium scaligerum TaxID=2052656 RepID=A0A2M9HT79_9BIFI|nr:hypothetical protein [Bifidobacterium scaligerum]PJM80014.1 hypothetical protein CUU80_02450 [Bifidobacterium scaligerum]
MESITHYINGVRIDESFCSIQQGSTLLAAISPNRTVTTAPGRHGSIPTGLPPVFPERTVTLNCKTFGNKYRAGLERLARMCTAPSVTLGRRFDDGPMQETAAELTSFAADDDSLHPGISVSFTAVFAMPQVWWRDPQAYDRPLASNATASLWPAARTWTQKYWTRWSGEANNSTSLLADFVTMWMGEENNSTSLLIPLADGVPDGMFGDAPVTDLILRLPKGVTSATVTDPVSNTGVIWQGNANANMFTYVDCGNSQAWQSTNDHQWTKSGSDVTGGLDYPAGGMLQCWPSPTDNGYRLATKLTGSADPLLAHVRRAWW